MTMPRGNDSKADQARSLRSAGKNVAEIAEAIGVSKPTVYNYLRGTQPKVASARKVTPRKITSDTTPTFTVTPEGDDRVAVNVRLVTDTKSAGIFLRKILA